MEIIDLEIGTPHPKAAVKQKCERRHRRGMIEAMCLLLLFLGLTYLLLRGGFGEIEGLVVRLSVACAAQKEGGEAGRCLGTGGEVVNAERTNRTQVFPQLDPGAPNHLDWIREK